MFLSKAHQRYRAQAEWTRELRRLVIADLPEYPRVLEIGCGTGAVLGEMPGERYGADLDGNVLRFAAERMSFFPVRSDGLRLPFCADAFDLVYCHFFLLWLKTPVSALKEMRRVCKPGGICAAFAEPDYASMQASPAVLRHLAEAQRDALIRRGIDSRAGSLLAERFRQAGFKKVESGFFKQNSSNNEFLQNEIRQMLCDIGAEAVPPSSEGGTYFVPTAFAVSRKSN